MDVAHDLHRPAGGHAPIAAAVVLHPHPAMGGDRRHPLVVAVAERLAAQGVAALRPDLADPDPARASATLEALAAELLAGTAADRLVLVGYSWGSLVSSLVEPPALAGRVLVAPPVGIPELAPPPGAGTPTYVLVPAHDQFGGPDAVEERFGEAPETSIEVVQGADHFLAGAVGHVADRAVAWVGALLRRPDGSPGRRGSARGPG